MLIPPSFFLRLTDTRKGQWHFIITSGWGAPWEASSLVLGGPITAQSWPKFLISSPHFYPYALPKFSPLVVLFFFFNNPSRCSVQALPVYASTSASALAICGASDDGHTGRCLSNKVDIVHLSGKQEVAVTAACGGAMRLTMSIYPLPFGRCISIEQ
jgi:hypothetical protein